MKMSRMSVLLLFVFAVNLFSATVPVTSTGLCANGSTWVTTVSLDQSTGAVVSACGIDCDGNAWAKNYNIYTPTPGGRNPAFTVQSQSQSELTVFSDLSVSYQVIDIVTGNYIGAMQGPSAAGIAYTINISSLPAGIYGLIGFTTSNETVGFAQFFR